MNKKVAIQGFEASFHEVAANKFFGGAIETLKCMTFQQVLDNLVLDTVDYGVMAIENSVAGSILPNYARLRDSDLKIIGEVFLRIEMNLLGIKGQKLSDITEVHSHPIALLQTHDFFRKQPHIQMVESADTALSAKEIADNRVMGRGALASRKAAELFGLEILAGGVESNKRNFTRFLVLEKGVEQDEKSVSKASWSFRTVHASGSLAKVLTILGDFDINLTKIQSLPVLGEEWSYYFYADLEFNDAETYVEAKNAVQPHIYDLKILGEYAQGEKYL